MLRRVLVGAVAALLPLTMGPWAAADPDAGPLEYVAIGDSFSAASGVFPLAPGAPLPCLQSVRNYPHLVATAAEASLRDVTCGGATTAHLSSSQYPGVAPQLAPLTATTDLVTVGIGGNDGGFFATTIALCGASGLSTLGIGNPCEKRYAARLTRLIDETVYPNVVSALGKVHAAAPNARVAIVGTPWLMPTEFVRSCYLKAPVARGDVPFVRALQARLNAAFERAAAETGSTYVDFAAVSDGHDMCQRPGVRWVEPALGGTNFVHPNALGASGMAAQVRAVLDLP